MEENRFAPSDEPWILQRLGCLELDSFCGFCHLVHSQGLGSILSAASQHLTWASTLSSLSLEMNGFGDEGCLKLVQSYLVARIISAQICFHMFPPSCAMLCHHSCISAYGVCSLFASDVFGVFFLCFFLMRFETVIYLQLYLPRVLHELVLRSTLSTWARRVGVGLEPDHVQKHRGALGRVCGCRVMIQSDDTSCINLQRL